MGLYKSVWASGNGPETPNPWGALVFVILMFSLIVGWILFLHFS